MTQPVRLGLLGLGTVGQGVVNVIARSGDEIERRIGRPLVVTRAVARDTARQRDCPMDGIELRTDAAALIAADDVDVVLELMGGIHPALEFVEQALRAGKPVVTANKALVAERGNELFAVARKSNGVVAYEAAVAGGIPIIKAVREGLAANRIHEVAGIINGTCNYILTEMRARGVEFEPVLAEAQAAGYAEADPSFDVDGVDAAHKLAILASIAFGMPLAFGEMLIEGIRGVRGQDIELAEEFGYRIKHLGLAKRGENGVELRAHPTLVAADHMLAKIDGVTNSVLLKGDAVGSTGFYGPGAGAEATASAVIADVIDVVRGNAQTVPGLAFAESGLNPLPVVPRTEIRSAWYLRMQVADEPGVLRSITSILADSQISIEAILQKEPRHGEDATVALITSVTREGDFDEALEHMLSLPFVRAGVSRFRVEH